MLNEELLSQPMPPAVVYVVTQDRVRSGKGIQVVETNGWDRNSGGQIDYVIGKRMRQGGLVSLYSLKECYASLEEAANAVEDMAGKILHEEQAKFNAVRARLISAKREAKKQAGFATAAKSMIKYSHL